MTDPGDGERAIEPATIARYRAFVLDHTAPCAVDGVPEIQLSLATEVTPLWTASAADLEDAEIEPPFWAFAWAGGVALARWVLDHADVVRDRVVMDLGAGSGLVAIAAKRAGAARVVAADVDPVALVACLVNADRNGVALETDVRDRLDDLDAGADVVLVGDLFYDAAIGPRVLAALRRWTASGAPRRAIAYVGDPGRGHLPKAEHLEPIATAEFETSVDLESAPSKRVTVYRFRSGG